MSLSSTASPLFESFVITAKDDSRLTLGGSGDPSNGSDGPNNTRFVPRNFLLEERLDASRVDSYASSLPALALSDFPTWNTVHNTYLMKHVFLPSPALHDFRFLSTDPS